MIYFIFYIYINILFHILTIRNAVISCSVYAHLENLEHAKYHLDKSWASCNSSLHFGECNLSLISTRVDVLKILSVWFKICLKTCVYIYKSFLFFYSLIFLFYYYTFMNTYHIMLRIQEFAAVLCSMSVKQSFAQFPHLTSPLLRALFEFLYRHKLGYGFPFKHWLGSRVYKSALGSLPGWKGPSSPCYHFGNKSMWHIIASVISPMSSVSLPGFELSPPYSWCCPGPCWPAPTSFEQACVDV